MSLAHELELDSQVELLERLQLLTRFGSNFVNVFGGLGAGKSWLAQRYLEHWAEDKNQSLLLCHPNQTDEQRRLTILNQLVSDPLFNPNDALLDSFSYLIEEETCDIVIAIDDAHLLSDTLLSELWMWVLEAQSEPRWTINVVLFAQANSLDALLTRLTYGQEHKPIELEIEPLSQYEADRLFEQRVMRYVEPEMERQVRAAFKKVKRFPGEIMALTDQKSEKRIIIRSIIASPFKIALVIILLLLVIGGGYWWMWSQPSADEKSQQWIQSQKSIEQTVIPTLSQDDVALSQAETVEKTSPTLPDLSGVEDDSASLPPDIKERSEGVGMADSEHQRIVISSDVVDALLEEEPTPPIEPKINRDLVAKERLPDESDARARANEQSNLIRFSFARETLLEMSPRSYTLQLAAVNSLQEVQAFIDQYQLEGQVNVYPTLRNEVDWYIVTYSNYPTIQLARDAVATLPSAIQALGPWAKSLSQVQREIERAK
ncbi:AAA family ATPase [Vibrio cincinnatiensis]|uniref:AAA family ATPase n=1 Tax=Vibrio cincinnatiensis TaxID=675 RepID=UPI0012ACFEE4|nr:AAA family ATPase [Vibrio cincinnatiensis]MCG3725212.1 cell division protein DamX [Vibrio cincinnatiensis]MCG3732256.1 cell division protein DamX [Vibrio cincinnatiensis]MCG3735749.1 cell division protein DamX [Vibrio cincinnatiensis]MCG3739677.1 cell division protein DamX [Vibrio cincinnatiensis]MCG3743050.1 cell division protein DamX [Vibrio cincinnatiensis]